MERVGGSKGRREDGEREGVEGGVEGGVERVGGGREGGGREGGREWRPTSSSFSSKMLSRLSGTISFRPVIKACTIMDWLTSPIQ